MRDFIELSKEVVDGRPSPAMTVGVTVGQCTEVVDGRPSPTTVVLLRAASDITA